MWEKLRVVWQIPELRKKILLTLGLLAFYRLGFQIPLPIVDAQKVEAFSKITEVRQGTSGPILVMAGGATALPAEVKALRPAVMP